MYQASNERKNRAKNVLGKLANQEDELFRILKKYESGKNVQDVVRENDKIAAKNAHEYFLKMAVILDDFTSTMEWEAEIISRVQRAKVLYRLGLAMMADQNVRQNVIDELIAKEHLAKQSHQSYLCDIRDP